MHESLKDGYGVDCRDIALSLVKHLRAEGHAPRISTIYGEVIDTLGNRARLVPTPYEEYDVTWGWHAVCEAAGVVYDPMLPMPMPLENYLPTAFEQQTVEVFENYLPF
jgi:hypothetical protein